MGHVAVAGYRRGAEGLGSRSSVGGMSHGREVVVVRAAGPFVCMRAVRRLCWGWEAFTGDCDHCARASFRRRTGAEPPAGTRPGGGGTPHHRIGRASLVQQRLSRCAPHDGDGVGGRCPAPQGPAPDRGDRELGEGQLCADGRPGDGRARQGELLGAISGSCGDGQDFGSDAARKERGSTGAPDRPRARAVEVHRRGLGQGLDPLLRRGRRLFGKRIAVLP